MRLIVVSGLSGSGKSVALHILEDLGYYCVDNLPVALLKSAITEVAESDETGAPLLAVGVDARSRQADLDAVPELIEELRQQGTQTELLFLQSDDDVLLQRYGESRRRHPLAAKDRALHAAITEEREILSVMVNAADLIIDTSRTSIYELADTIRERVDRRTAKSLSVQIESFGYKIGIPAGADFVFDLRSLPNPYWTLELRGLSGRDQEVIDFLEAQPMFISMYEDILSFLQRWIPEFTTVSRAYLTVAIGCTGGQHRSVRMAEKLAEALRADFGHVLTRHNELGSHTLSS